MREGFNFYRSYWDVANELNDKDRLAFYDALMKRQFTGIETDLEGMSKFAYLSQKHSIDRQVKGYEDKTKKTLLNPNQDPTQGGRQGGSVHPSLQVKEKEKVKEKVINIEERKLKFADALKPFLDEYGRDMLNDFYFYWTEHGENDKKLRFEKEKTFGISQRLRTWLSRNPKQYQKEGISPEELKAIKLGFLKPKQ
jgi:hypothetical protein